MLWRFVDYFCDFEIFFRFGIKQRTQCLLRCVRWTMYSALMDNWSNRSHDILTMNRVRSSQAPYNAKKISSLMCLCKGHAHAMAHASLLFSLHLFTIRKQIDWKAIDVFISMGSGSLRTATEIEPPVCVYGALRVCVGMQHVRWRIH